MLHISDTFPSTSIFKKEKLVFHFEYKEWYQHSIQQALQYIQPVRFADG